MDKYAVIKERLINIAKENNSIKAVVAIGSSVRGYSKSDEYSDIDIIIGTDDPEGILYTDEILAQLGDIKISFVEHTLGGGMERRVFFDGALDADFIVFTPEQFNCAVTEGVANEIMNRGYLVMYDSMDITPLLDKYIVPSVRNVSMTEAEFCNIVNDFWFHTIWASKKILRGEIWVAKMCIDGYLKDRLLSVMEYHRYQLYNQDVWHCGRFLEKWAGDENISALKNSFAHYDKSDMIKALFSTAELFSSNAKAIANKCEYRYPEAAEKYATELVKGYFIKP